MIERTEAEIMKKWKGDISSPLASICSRTYNIENFVAEAIDSFLMQETDFPFEIVIDDDCSSDGTAKVIRKYMGKFPNIIKADLREKNVGLRVNFVENMQRAKGKYIALCDGDDYWTDPLQLQKQVDFLKKNNEYVLAFTAMKTLYESGTGDVKRNFRSKPSDKESLDIQKHLLKTGSCTVCFRNLDIIKNYPFEYHCSPSNDLFLWSLLGGYGKGKFLKDIKAVIYRIHGDGDYSGKTIAERNTLQHQTNYALYMYYLRIGNIPLSEYFYRSTMQFSIIERGRWYHIKRIMDNTIIGRVFKRVKRIFK